MDNKSPIAKQTANDFYFIMLRLNFCF